MTQTLKNIFALVLLAGVAGLGYFMFIQKDTTTLLINEDPLVANQLLMQASSFIAKRQKLDALSIDTAILIDQKFNSLVTYTTSVPEQPLGKNSLFEPAKELSSVQ